MSTPIANNIVRIHITSWRICGKSFCRLEVSATNQTTLVLCRNGNVIIISSSMRVSVCIDPFHRIDLATCFGESSHFFIRQNNTCIELPPLVPFGASRLSESSFALRACRMGCEGFIHRPSSSTLSFCCFFAHQPSSLEEIHFSDVRNAPSGIGMRRLVASQLFSLQFWLVSKIVRVVLAFHQRVKMNSRVTNRLQVTMPVTLLLFRPSASPFAFLSSLIVSATVGLIGARSSMKPCCV